MSEAQKDHSFHTEQLTPEQQRILQSQSHIRINAVAGSGKTTTLIAYARSRLASARILYLAFNRSVKIEATAKFAAAQLKNVAVETAHSLAYKYIVPQNGYRLKANGYKTHEIASLLQLKGEGDRHAAHIIASHINHFVSYFCNSDAQKVQQLNYLDVVTDAQAKKFVQAFYPAIEQGARLLLAKMNEGSIEITHDFYLKKFQLAAPQLPYDYILFDEGQDASGAMVAVFLQQKAVKVIVGDTHQQIYGWRYAVNSLDKTNFKTYQLTQSFRFNQAIANLATAVLQWKEILQPFELVTVTGKGNSKPGRVKAFIARSNLGLLLKAIEFCTKTSKQTKIYFEGNIHSYTYADEGASLYDVLNLHNGKKANIRDPLIGSMLTIDDLKEYIEKTGDAQLGMMVEIVEEYGDEIPSLLQSLKDRHLGDENKHEAAIIFSTVHKCKGMEYDEVELVPDFISEATLKRLVSKEKEEPINRAKLTEEINLLYVAVTRTRYLLHIPENLVPEGFVPGENIKVVVKKEIMTRPEIKEEPVQPRKLRRISKEEKDEYEMAYFFKKEKANTGQRWTADMDKELTELYEQRMMVSKIATKLNRTESAVLLRIKRLEL